MLIHHLYQFYPVVNTVAILAQGTTHGPMRSRRPFFTLRIDSPIFRQKGNVMQLLFPQVPQTLSARSSNQKQQKINNFGMKLLKKHPTFSQLFLQSLLWNCFVKTVLYCGTKIGRKSFWCFATLSAKFCLLSKAAKTPSCWKRCCQQQNEPMNLLAKGAKFQRRIRDQSVQLDPLVQEISLFQLVAGSGISSKMVFMQPSTAKKTLQKELRNNKCFSRYFVQVLQS